APIEGRAYRAPCLSFPIRKEVRVDEGVDDSLVCGINRLELNAHAHATIAPRDVPFRVDVALRSGHPETDFDLRARFERACGPDRDAAVAQIERQRRGNRIAESILNRNPQHDARAVAAGVV